ncbi:hypothetical protein NDU88_011644 [Pleurodeles waltl]|uniref:Uncharacterized protein n=1 Tax=Pleurodeles waltl TaxID=8319 RepID=A0AAV7S4C9_PLEWA|nr:hypothetical protein NDU88_011644 [Pleurodeles waltl]
MPLWRHKKSGAESGRQHGAEARSVPGWLAIDPFSGVAGLLNRWAVLVLWEALDERVTPRLVEDAVESVKLRGAKLELKAAGQVGWLFLSALRTVYRKTLTHNAEIRKLRDEVAALQERQLLMKEIIESAVTRVDQMEARCTALAVRVAKQKSRQKPKIPSFVQVRALVRKGNWDPYTWNGTVLDNDDDWNWEDEVEVCVAELGGVESGEGSVGEVEGGRENVMEVLPLVQNKSKGVNGGQIQNSHLVRDYTQSELLEITHMFRQMPAEPLFKWLVRLWDTGAEGTYLSPTELLKMGSVTTHAMLGQWLRGAQGQQAFSLMGWLMEGVKQLYPTAIDVEESWGPWHTISEANEQLREMGMQNAAYSQHFFGPDIEPVTAGIRARLIRNAPPLMKGALLALLGPAQGRPVGDVVLLMAQLEGLDRQKSARAVGQDNKYKGGESTIKVARQQMWLAKKEEIVGKPTPYLLNEWKALQRRQKEKEAFDESSPQHHQWKSLRKKKQSQGKIGRCLSQLYIPTRPAMAGKSQTTNYEGQAKPRESEQCKR